MSETSFYDTGMRFRGRRVLMEGSSKHSTMLYAAEEAKGFGRLIMETFGLGRLDANGKTKWMRVEIDGDEPIDGEFLSVECNEVSTGTDYKGWRASEPGAHWTFRMIKDDKHVNREPA